MKFIACSVILAAVVLATNANVDIKNPMSIEKNKESWRDMVSPCIDAVRAQVQREINAALTYLSMAAYFSRDVVNRPGFAKKYFESASEERQHAIKLIEYLLMRGELKDKVSDLISTGFGDIKTEWSSGLESLENALELEASVTKHIRKVIDVCEVPPDGSNFNDYHLSDYLTGEFLTEQYHGQRELAGQISQLRKLMEQHGALGEFLFDKKLL